MDENNTKLSAKKSLGQHFLTSNIVPTWMCNAANIQEGDTVLEIGPGTGVLTKEILSRGATVIALEADPRALDVLKKTFTEEIASGELILYHKDVRNLNLESIGDISHHSFKVVSNIPYYLSGFLLRVFLESDIQPTIIVYLIQKEVAKRITTNLSRNEKESLLSLSVKAYGNPSYIRTVSRGHFSPPPKVDSAIIAITDITHKKFQEQGIDESLFFKILHLGFGQKRKQLLSNLSKKYSREKLIHIFSTVGIQPTIRAEDVSLEKWLILTKEIAKIS